MNLAPFALGAIIVLIAAVVILAQRYAEWERENILPPSRNKNRDQQ